MCTFISASFCSVRRVTVSTSNKFGNFFSSDASASKCWLGLKQIRQINDSVTILYRPRHGQMADERDASEHRVSALEKALRGFADRGSDAVVRPYVGLTFDSIGEAYDFYNLYSWEVGFGIRYGRSRTNVKGSKSMQKFLCVCSVRLSESTHYFISTSDNVVGFVVM